ncbi:DUF2283 domain-containing protein [Anaerolineae bacterium CFX7]|nr:DUF2283 domain-containing protein [Anaerolineae bacterium CFX7]
MEEVTTMFYDKESDVLYITIGEPQIAISRELENDVLLRVHPETGQVVGMTVLNFTSRFSNLQQQHTLPVRMTLNV